MHAQNCLCLALGCLNVCNSLELDKEFWYGCCLDGRKTACLTVLTVLPLVCAHCWHQLILLQQNWARKLKQDLQNIWRPWQSFWRDKTWILLWSTVLTPLSNNTDCSFCSSSKSVFAGPNFTKHHSTKSPLGQLGQSSFTTALMHLQNLWGMYKL